MLCPREAPLKCYIQYSSSFWGPQYKKDMDLLGWVQRRATRLIKGMEHLSCEERERQLGLFSMKRRLQRNLTAAFQYLREAYKKDGE